MENEIKETEQNNIETSDVASNDEEFEGDISGEALNMTDSHSEALAEESQADENPKNTEDEEPVIVEAPTIPEPDGFVYFSENKSAKMQPIENYVCRIPLEQWQEFCTLTIGKDYDIIDDEFIDIRLTDTYIAEKLEKIKTEKLAENTTKAKQAVENGYVTYKNAQFETNAQTVGDLTATMLMLQAQQNPLSNIRHSELVSESLTQTDMEDENLTYTWLSKDDKAVELTLEDFITLGNLIAEYKNTIWSNKYIAFKTAIENAQTLEELNEIELDYGNFDV